MSNERIALFYGHCASNIGDLAINEGECHLFSELYPSNKLTVVMLDAQNSRYLQDSKLSFLGNKEVEFRYLDTKDDELLCQLMNDPGILLDHLDLQDCVAIWIASGEHLFEYASQENRHAVFWRTLPILAAKSRGKFAGILPSTYGPFEGQYAEEIIKHTFTIADLVFARDVESYNLVNKLTDGRAGNMGLDPACYLDYERISRSYNTGKLGLVMRSEGWGIRLSSTKRKALTKDFKTSSYRMSKAFRFSVRAISELIDNFKNGVTIFVQSAADRELAEAIDEHFSVRPNIKNKITIVYPSSIEEYLTELSLVDELVTSRFHASIFGLMLGKKVHSVYFVEHGHKIPGIFEYLNIRGYCHDISLLPPEVAVERIKMKTHEVWDGNRVFSLVTEEKTTLVNIVKSVKAKPAIAGDSRLPSMYNVLLFRVILDTHDKEKKDINLKLRQLKKVKDERDKYKQALDEQNRKYKNLINSTTYLVGRQIIKDIKRPHHWILMPFKMVRIFLRYKERVSSFPDERSVLKLIPDPKKNAPSRKQGVKKICYLLHNSFPYSSGGYATRAHGVAVGLKSNGYDVVCLTRPGFPLDINSSMNVGDVEEHEIDGIIYKRISHPLRKGKSNAEYMNEIVDPIAKEISKIDPDLVIGASFYLTALPGLIGARRIGVPFIYEVRGLAEITKISRDALYGQTDRYKNEVFMESETAKQADCVITLTQAMKNEMVGRGVPADKIMLVPNSTNPKEFSPRPRDMSLAKELSIHNEVPVIGYIGTLVDYEGLDYLAQACEKLKGAGKEFRLLIVGSENTLVNSQGRGVVAEKIRNIALRADFMDWLILPGRVPHEKVEEYYSLIDIAVFPRKALPVCEIVSPMKPLEALAMEKAVVVSSVGALQEMIKHEETGMIFQKGNIDHLTETLSRLINDDRLREKLGKAGRKWVEQERTWEVRIRSITDRIFSLKQPSAGANRSVKYPIWWEAIPACFREQCDYVDVTAWTLSEDVSSLKLDYISRFGQETVDKRIPLSNWQRADICAQLVTENHPSDVLDIGSGLGEFVNLVAGMNPDVSISSVDVRDYSLWFDRMEKVKRIYKSVFDLGESEASDVVTCFEVIEHLPPEKVAEAVQVLRSIAKRKLLISVPFMEPPPMYKGHFTRFCEGNLLDLFPDAKFTVFGKGGKDPKKVRAWIMCDITISNHKAN